MERYQLIFFIFILYYTGIFKCSVSCAKSDELQTLTSTKSNHPDVHNDYQGLTEQYRTSRGVAGSRRHLRVGDAHQVANYFLTGGPLKGHAHFRRETNCDSNNDENNVVGMNNPVNEDNTYPSENEQNSMTNLSDSIVGASHIPALYSPFGAAPLVQAPNLYTPLINSVLHPALNTLNTMPHLPLGNDLISSVLHPNLHPHIQALHDIPRALVKTATLPIHSLINARSELRNMLRPQGSLLGNTNRALQRTKLKKNSKNKLMPTNEQYSPISGSPLTNYNNNIHPYSLTHYLQPTGYIVQYIPHSKQTRPLSQIVGSPHQQSSDLTNNTDNNVKEEENVTDSINNENEGTTKNEQSTEKNQAENDSE